MANCMCNQMVTSEILLGNNFTGHHLIWLKTVWMAYLVICKSAKKWFLMSMCIS